jgi:molybdopterin-synthase adenylyltransferase
VRPQLKEVVWERVGAELRVVYDRREQLLIGDPDGSVQRLLELLRDGSLTIAELADRLGLPAEDVAVAMRAFDEHGLLEDRDRLGTLTSTELERFHSNLAFFESFASMESSREDLQRRLRAAHVLVLGAGGLGSNTIPHLCGIGVGRLTLLDRDTVEPRNFARQYLYKQADIGAPKVHRAAGWVRAFDPSIEVGTLDADITGSEQLAGLLDELRPDVVASGVDRPREIDTWVNAACVSRGVPFVRGGMLVTEGIVWSVDPGRSACYTCARTDFDREVDGGGPELDEQRAGQRLYATKVSTNRGIGPVAGLLGSLVAFELLRYLTGFEPPTYAGRPLLIDFAGGCGTRRLDWSRNPACPACGSAPVNDSGEGGEDSEDRNPQDREHPRDGQHGRAAAGQLTAAGPPSRTRLSREEVHE